MQSWGSFNPLPVVVWWRLISMFSLRSKFRWRVALFLSLKVARISGFSQLMTWSGQLRACFEIPEMCSSVLVFSLDCLFCSYLINPVLSLFSPYGQFLPYKFCLSLLLFTVYELWVCQNARKFRLSLFNKCMWSQKTKCFAFVIAVTIHTMSLRENLQKILKESST